MSTGDFDRRLAELDVYLQMLIERRDAIDDKIKLSPSGAERTGLELIRSNLDSLVESIKHSIVLIQIAGHQVKEKCVLHSEPKCRNAPAKPFEWPVESKGSDKWSRKRSG